MDLKSAIAVLKNGGVVVFPTETSYGIGCDATNARAVRQVFALKGRPDGKGTPLIVDSLTMAEKWGLFNVTAKKLAKKHWPGALTIIVPLRVFARNEETKQSRVSPLVLQNKTVALRVSSHPIAHALAKGLGRPLVATSANLSGEPPAFSLKALSPLLKSFPPAILNAGSLPKRKPTTLVKVIDDQCEVLRQGSIKL